MLTKRLLLAVMAILTLAAGALQADGDSVRGKELGEWCSDCHGDDSLGERDNVGTGTQGMLHILSTNVLDSKETEGAKAERLQASVHDAQASEQ